MIVTLVLMILLVAGNAFGSVRITSADPNTDATTPIPVPTGDTKQAVDAQVENACVTQLTAYGDAEFDKYKIFMEDNFKNKSTTSSLLNLGISRYDKFKKDIGVTLKDLTGKQLDLAVTTGSPVASQGVGLSRCDALARQYISDASQMLKMRAITTSNIKKNSIFVEKYKQINGKLRALNLDVLRMVVNISSFQQKLPCYLKSCA